MFHIRRNVFFVMFSTLTALAPNPAAAELASPCETPQVLLPQDQVRQSQGAVDETHCYQLDLTTSGLLYLDVSVAGSDPSMAEALPSRAQLDVFSANLSGSKVSGTKIFTTKSAALYTLGRTATEHLILAEAGTYFVAVRAEDPRRPLPPYRLESRFVDLNKSETDGEIEIEIEKSETDGEIEIEIEKFAANPSLFACRSADKSETDGEIEIEIEKSETDGEIEIEIEKGAATAALDCDHLLALVDLLCRASQTEDHSDGLACATPFERRAHGEIGNGWGDDADVFRFQLDHWQTVEITTEGGIDTYGVLYDQTGQRLAADGQSTGEDEGFRLVRTLGPGTYFVRVEGSDATGAYTLVRNDLDR